MEPLCDIVLVDYLTPELVQRAVDSINERFEVPFTLTVIDAYRDRLGYAEAVNRGLEGGSAPICLALNADVECLGSQWPIIDLFEMVPNVAVIGPRQRTTKGLVTHAGIFGEEPFCTHRAWLKPLASVEEETAESILDVHSVPGSVYFMHREPYEKVGGWDERLSFYFEETLHSLRMKARGHRVVYTGSVDWIHEWAASPVDQEWRAEQAERNRKIFWEICRAEGLPGGQPAEVST